MEQIRPKKLILSKAKNSDAQAIRALESLVWKEEVVNKYDIPMFVRFGYVFVAKYDSKLVGAIVSYPTNTDEIYVADLVVHSKYRRLNIGEKLYKKLFQVVKGKDVITFLDPNNIPTMKLHEKFKAKVIKKVQDAYNLNRGIETGIKLLVRIKNR